jgi:hypothetical protein
MHRHGNSQVAAKKFERASFQAVPEDLLDSAEKAFIRLLRPRDNQHLYGGVLTDHDREVLTFLGYPVKSRAA